MDVRWGRLRDEGRRKRVGDDRRKGAGKPYMDVGGPRGGGWGGRTMGRKILT